MSRNLSAFLLAAALAVAPGKDGCAATLRPAVTLARSVVLLSDLFDDAGPASSRVLGPGPTPGNRIVVESPQLAAIARQFGVDWRPSSPADRVVLDRPGRPLPQENVMAALRTALAGVGGPTDGAIDLPGYTAPMIPQECNPQSQVEQIDYDGASGRFTALLAIMGSGMDTLRLRLSGHVEEMLEIPLLVRRVAAGSPILADDLKMTRLPAGRVRGDVVRDISQAAGLAPRRMLAPGQPIMLADLRPPILVQRGARVTMLLAAPGLTLTATGQAMEPGSMGERIQVLNPVSRAVVEAEVMGPDRVRVTPGAVPMQTAQVAER
jgi:flagella basal body P-ring formation protein FlgA